MHETRSPKRPDVLSWEQNITCVVIPSTMTGNVSLSAWSYPQVQLLLHQHQQRCQQLRSTNTCTRTHNGSACNNRCGAVAVCTAAPEGLVSAAPLQVTPAPTTETGTKASASQHSSRANSTGGSANNGPWGRRETGTTAAEPRQMLSSARTRVQLILNYSQSQIPDVFAEVSLA